MVTGCPKSAETPVIWDPWYGSIGYSIAVGSVQTAPSSVSHPVTQPHSTVSPSIDTAGKGKNDRWASAGLSKIAHMHESEFWEARQHCSVVPKISDAI